MAGNRWYHSLNDPGPLASSNPLFKKLSIPKVEDIYKLNIGKIYFLLFISFNSSIILGLVFHKQFSSHTFKHSHYANRLF